MFSWLVEPAPRTSDLKEGFVASFILLWLADVALTVVGVDRHGLQLEYNPWMRWLLEKDVIWFIAVKMASLYFILLLINHIRTWVFFALSLIMLPIIGSWCLILFRGI